MTFALDTFQERAIAAVDRGESVLVAAPTGAGKTVVAEHAVDRVLADGRGRAFYTTPIKALSNQKFHDLAHRHGRENVGLLTGDNAINGRAPVVVMTTEVLRNMIYAGRPLEDLRFVVLDEVHYLQEPYRGPVWEEVIIHAPAHVRLVCLSATVSNVDELAAWLTEVRGPTTTVIEHERPVPLEHLYAVADRHEDRLWVLPTLVAGPSGPAPEAHRAASLGRPNPDGPAYDASRSRRRRWRTPGRLEVVDHLEAHRLLPAIYFIFSRLGCDEAARTTARAGLALTTPEERERIAEIVDRHVAHLDDRDLAALGFAAWVAQLDAGVAAHHAGMVPPFKEAVEQCFVAGLVKVVFATETLALGINMPARSVVVETLSKFTGERHERLTPAQFTQLTGRAGRRGIDDQGTAVVLWSPFVAFADAAALAASRRFVLSSAFRPTYNMAANLVRRHDPDTAHRLLALSFAQFTTDRSLVAAERRLEDRRRSLDAARAEAQCDRGDVEEYRRLVDAGRSGSRRGADRDLEAALADLRPGDVVDVALRSGDQRLAVLSVAHRARGAIRVRGITRTGQVVNVGAAALDGPPERRGSVDLPEPYRPNNPKFRREAARRLDRARVGARARRPASAADEHPVAACPDAGRHLDAARRAARLSGEVERLAGRIQRDTGSLAREFDRVLQVLDGHGHLDGWSLTAKGETLARVYHECDLVVTEGLHAGTFDDLDAASLAALVSCFTYEHRSSEPPPPPSFPSPDLRHRWQHLAGLAGELREEEAEMGLRPTRELDPGFVDDVWRWASGRGLAGVLEEGERSGGDFVRQVRQLIDLLRQVAEVAPDPRTGAVARRALGLLDRGVVTASP